MGVRDHVPCEYFQNNGVTWCIDVYFEDICLNPFSFLFISNSHISHPLPSKQSCFRIGSTNSDQL